jgi:hypothetical protein
MAAGVRGGLGFSRYGCEGSLLKPRRASLGLAWYLGSIQYCVCLFVGGALWFLMARLTGFFGNDPAVQAAACVVLLVVILAESWWAHMPGSGNELGDFAVDVLTSAGIAGFGMAVTAFILMWLLG